MLQRYSPRGPKSIISNLRSGQKTQHGSPRRLDLVGHIRVEKLSSREGIKVRPRVSIRIDNCACKSANSKLRNKRIELTNNIIQVTSTRSCIGGVLVERTKVLPEFTLLFDSHRLLISKNYCTMKSSVTMIRHQRIRGNSNVQTTPRCATSKALIVEWSGCNSECPARRI